jgi:TolB protein
MRGFPTALLLALAILAVLPAIAGAQDDRIRLGIQYEAGVRPGIVVLAAPELDSVRKVIERDLDFSDRFEVGFLTEEAGRLSGPINTELFKGLGVTWGVELQPALGGVAVKVHHLPSGEVRQEWLRLLDVGAVGDGRMAIHRISDDITELAAAARGIAATRIYFAMEDAIWRIDSDGANQQRVSRGTGIALSPALSPDGQRLAFTELRDYAGVVVLQNLLSGARQQVPGTNAGGQSITPVFSPNGREMLYARTAEEGTDLYAVDIAQSCCVRRLTTGGKLAVSMSPAYSPDGRRVAFVSDRGGSPQIFVMDADGTNQRVLVPFEFGQTGPSQSPDWSPDGAAVAFHRDVAGGRQIHVYELTTGRTRTVTTSGRNEDPNWAPDARHLVFTSTRTGRNQLWILDLESGRMRQLMNVTGKPRLAAWSPRVGQPTS